jgi:hypothetical protein
VNRRKLLHVAKHLNVLNGHRSLVASLYYHRRTERRMNALTYSWLLASLIVLPRFTGSRNNFEKHYRLLADAWSV